MSNIYLYNDENSVIGANGTFALGYELELVEKYSMGSDDYESLNDAWSKALKDLPSGSIFVKQDVFLKEHLDTSNYPSNNFLQKATKSYFKNREFLSHKCFVFFVLPDSETFTTKISNPFKKLNRKKFERYDTRQESFMVSVEQAVNFLNGVKINSGRAFHLTPMESEDILGYYEFYFNNFQNDFVTDRKVKSNYIQVGDRLMSAVCTRDEESFPEKFNPILTDKQFSTAKYKFFQNFGDLFGFGLAFEHIYTQIMIFEDNLKQLERLRKNNDLLNKSARFDPNNKVNAEKTDKLIERLANNIDGERIVRGHINVFFFGNTEDEIKIRRNLVVEKFKEIDIKPRQPISNYLNSIYHNTFFLFTQYFSDRQLFYGSLNIGALFFNNCTNYKEDKDGIILNSRLANIPMRVDIWDDKKKYVNARNFIILAPTGFGKSFLANHIFRQVYEDGSKLVIIDLGGSYRKLAALYPEDTVFLSYVEGQPIGLNPFDLQGDVLTTSKIEDLVDFIIIHFKRNDKASESEKTALRKIIEHYYDKHSNYSLLDFISFVRSNKKTILPDLNIREDFFDIENFLFLMSEFEDGGVYDFLYRDETNSNLTRIKDKKIIVFELDEVKENELLLTIMLQLISSTVNEVVWKDKKTRGYVFFDEFAKQLKFEGVLERIEYFYQAIRKQNGSVGVVLQAISQLPENQTAKSIIENTQILYVLNAKDYRELQKRFNLSEHAYNQMVSVSSDFSGKYKYSEIFLMRGNHHQVYRLEVPEEVFWAYQTEGDKNAELMEVYNQTGNMEEAIKTFIKQLN